MAYIKSIAFFLRVKYPKPRKSTEKPRPEEDYFIVRPADLSKEEKIVRSLYSLK